jgi:hypothetical protein
MKAPFLVIPAAAVALALTACTAPTRTDADYNSEACKALAGVAGEFIIAAAAARANGEEAAIYQAAADALDAQQGIAENTPTPFGVDLANSVLEDRVSLSEGTLGGGSTAPEPGSATLVCQDLGIDLDPYNDDY